MAASKVSFRYFWVKVVDQEGQIKDDARRLQGMSKPQAAPMAYMDVIIWADAPPEVVVDVVRDARVDKDPSLKIDTIALGAGFGENDARRWIESDDGKEWLGHAKSCVLHRVAVRPTQQHAGDKARIKAAKAARTTT